MIVRTRPTVNGERMKRFFDDLYLDNTLARVMLGNATDYESCTILEPQIPMSWSEERIEVEVNLGGLPGGEAYLYVFNEEGVRNEGGYAIAIGE